MPAKQASTPDRLESWKDIAEYLHRDVRTVQRWEEGKGLPVRRLPGGERARIFALRSELDAWWNSRGLQVSLEEAEHKPAEPAPARKAKVVVLPFANLSGDPAQDYLGDGVTEEIITELAALAPERLAVIARTTAMHYKGSHKDVAHIGRELGVDYAVEGGVRRAEDRITVNVQLIQVKDQTHLLAERYDEKLHDMLSAASEATQAIAAQIGIPPLADKLQHGRDASARKTGKATENFPAYNLYMQGRYHLNKYTSEGLARAKQCFEDAIAQAPAFAPAHNSLGEVYWFLGFNGIMPPKEAFSAAVWSALRAIEIDDTLAEAHTLLGMLRKELDYNWPEVHREMRRALELNPWSPTARLWYANSGLMPLGRIDEAIAEIERGLELDPLSGDMHFWLASMFDFGRQYDRGLQEALLLVEHAPSHWVWPLRSRAPLSRHENV